MKFHFLADFREKWNFAPGAENLHPDHGTLGTKKYVLNMSKNVYNIEKLFLESPDIILSVFWPYVGIYHLVLEKAPLDCKNALFFKITKCNRTFLHIYQGAFSNTSYLHFM